MELQSRILSQGWPIDLSRLESALSFHVLLIQAKGLSYRFGCTASFLLRNLLDGALDFRDIHCLIVDLNDVSKDGSHFGELVLVSSDKIDFSESHDGRLIINERVEELRRELMAGGSTTFFVPRGGTAQLYSLYITEFAPLRRHSWTSIDMPITPKELVSVLKYYFKEG